MARPIKETPILYGRDSKSFSKKIAENEKKPASREECERMLENYNKLKQTIKV